MPNPDDDDELLLPFVFAPSVVEELSVLPAQATIVTQDAKNKFDAQKPIFMVFLPPEEQSTATTIGASQALTTRIVSPVSPGDTARFSTLRNDPPADENCVRCGREYVNRRISYLRRTFAGVRVRPGVRLQRPFSQVRIRR